MQNHSFETQTSELNKYTPGVLRVTIFKILLLHKNQTMTRFCEIVKEKNKR